MKRRFNILLLLGLTSASFLFFSISCTGVKNFLGLSKPADSAETTVSRFLSKIRLHPGNPDSHYLLACYYQKSGKYREAVEEFRKVLLIDPGYVKAYNGIGVSYDLLGEYSNAIEFYKQALKLDPKLDYIYNNLGYSYLLSGKLDEAVINLKKAVSLNDQDKRFHNNLALAYAEKGEFDLAFAEFMLGYDEAKAHYNMAQIYFRRGLFDKAKSHYTSALGISPSATAVRTGVEAATALSRIFYPEAKDTKAEKLVVPENPTSKSPPPNLQEGLSNISGGVGREKAEKLDGIGTISPAAKMIETEDLTGSKSPNIAPHSYEVQIASFRSKEMAVLIEGSFRMLGYRINLRQWKDDKEGKYYRLLTGPFGTRDEAFACKAKIEKEYKFSPIIVQSKAVKTEERTPIIRDQHSTKVSLVSLKQVEIEISNGNGVNRMARRVGDFLKGKGLKVVRLTNADHFNHSGTRIYYQKDYHEEAVYVAGQLPLIQDMEETKKFDRPGIKVKLLIGKDLVPQNKLLASNSHELK